MMRVCFLSSYQITMIASKEAECTSNANRVAEGHPGYESVCINGLSYGKAYAFV